MAADNFSKNYLDHKLGPQVLQALAQANVSEVMRNEDGALWARVSGVDQHIGYHSSPDARAFAAFLAEHSEHYLDEQKPFLDTMLPGKHIRVHVTVPPMVKDTTFNLRKYGTTVKTLEEYVASQVVTTHQADALRTAIQHKKNILISGGPGAGKTSLLNTLLREKHRLVSPNERALLLEDTREIQSPFHNTKSLITTHYHHLGDLLFVAMRNAPQFIVVGEVRDNAASHLLQAWNTGCRGGFGTIHANSAKGAIQRIRDLASSAGSEVANSLLAQSIDLVVQLDADSLAPSGRRVTQILELTGVDEDNNTLCFNPLGECIS